MPSTVSGLPSTSPTLLVIVGPTASGKSALALKTAKEFDGEIIAADSRTVYRGMDIGTAKPTKDDQAKVKHWGLDLVEPGQRFTAYQFKSYAQNAVSDVQKRGKLPILVGGTGLYIDSLIFDFGFRQDVDQAKRKKLEAMNIEALQDFIREMSLPMPFNFKNRRHLIRTVETKGQAGSRKHRLPKGVILVGIMPADKVLKKRIDRRIENWFSDGLIDETEKLLRNYGEKVLKTTGGIGYGLMVDYLNERTTVDEAKENFKKEHWQYARRQKTWFKGNKFIHWFESPEQAYSYIKSRLNT